MLGQVIGHANAVNVCGHIYSTSLNNAWGHIDSTTLNYPCEVTLALSMYDFYLWIRWRHGSEDICSFSQGAALKIYLTCCVLEDEDTTLLWWVRAPWSRAFSFKVTQTQRARYESFTCEFECLQSWRHDSFTQEPTLKIPAQWRRHSDSLLVTYLITEGTVLQALLKMLFELARVRTASSPCQVAEGRIR